MAYELRHDVEPFRIACDGAYMTLDRVLLSIIFSTLSPPVLLDLFRMAGDQDRATRDSEKCVDSASDATIAQFGND